MWINLSKRYIRYLSTRCTLLQFWKYGLPKMSSRSALLRWKYTKMHLITRNIAWAYMPRRWTSRSRHEQVRSWSKSFRGKCCTMSSLRAILESWWDEMSSLWRRSSLGLGKQNLRIRNKSCLGVRIQRAKKRRDRLMPIMQTIPKIRSRSENMHWLLLNKLGLRPSITKMPRNNLTMPSRPDLRQQSASMRVQRGSKLSVCGCWRAVRALLRVRWGIRLSNLEMF